MLPTKHTRYMIRKVPAPRPRPTDPLFLPDLMGAIEVDASCLADHSAHLRCATLRLALEAVASENLIPADDGSDDWAVLLEIVTKDDYGDDHDDKLLFRRVQLVHVIDGRAACDALQNQQLQTA